MVSIVGKVVTGITPADREADTIVRSKDFLKYVEESCHFHRFLYQCADGSLTSIRSFLLASGDLNHGRDHLQDEPMSLITSTPAVLPRVRSTGAIDHIIKFDTELRKERSTFNNLPHQGFRHSPSYFRVFQQPHKF